ncbi:hypothetical protein DFH09DRAFT_1276177 [Mycena vulgaris]|nr:hypothetical protein DFH09DRAFT_1276177 [Mycena vulgaris]
MPDTISKLQIFVFAAISLASVTTQRYIGLGLATTSLAIYVAHHHSPSQRLDRLENSFKVTEEILERAKMDCARDQVELMRKGNRLRQYVHPRSRLPEYNTDSRTKILASKIQTRMLEAEDTTWEEYFKAIRGIMQSIDKCRREVKEIRTSTLLTIEGERQRKLSEGIKESSEVISAVLRAPSRHAYRRSGTGADDFFQESYIRESHTSLSYLTHLRTGWCTESLRVPPLWREGDKTVIAS